MATLKEQLRLEEEKLRKAEALLESAKAFAERQNVTSTPATKKADREVQRLKSSVAKIRANIATAAAEKRESKKTVKQRQEEAATKVRESLPFPVNDKIFNDLRTIVGPNLSTEIFNQGGIGAGVFVYQGQKTVKEASPTGGMYDVKRDNVALSNDIVNSFWTDKAIQRKVLNALIAAGNRNATQLDAYATWQSVVQQSANLYAAGKGPKFTPMDILNMSITKAGGAKPDVTTYLDVPKDNELKQVLKDRLFPILRKEPSENDPLFQSLFNDIKSLYQKGETTTTTVDPKTGRKTVKRTGGVTDAMIKAKIDKYYNENNQDFLEAKSLEAVDYFSQWQRS